MRLSERLDAVFGALADPTRRQVLERLLGAGSVSVPQLSGDLPISRQAVAKHLAVLGEAGLIERLPGAGREVRYGLAAGALAPAAAWLQAADRAWDARLQRLAQATQATQATQGTQATQATQGTQATQATQGRRDPHA